MVAAVVLANSVTLHPQMHGSPREGSFAQSCCLIRSACAQLWNFVDLKELLISLVPGLAESKVMVVRESEAESRVW